MMNKEKLDKAIEENMPSYYPDASYETGYSGGFEDGVHWSFSLPIRERLTDEEKKLLNALFQEYKNKCNHGSNEVDQIYGKAGVIILNQIFGPGLFNS